MKRALAALLAASLARPVSAQATAFVHVNVVPMDDARVLRDQTVVVDQGIITQIGRAHV